MPIGDKGARPNAGLAHLAADGGKRWQHDFPTADFAGINLRQGSSSLEQVTQIIYRMRREGGRRATLHKRMPNIRPVKKCCSVVCKFWLDTSLDKQLFDVGNSFRVCCGNYFCYSFVVGSPRPYCVVQIAAPTKGSLHEVFETIGRSRVHV